MNVGKRNPQRNEPRKRRVIMDSVAVQTDPLEIVIDLSEVTKRIKKQLEKKNTKWDEVEKCMAATYNYRRSFILSKAPIVKTVKEIYPGLFNFHQIKSEFCRIKNNENIYETFLSNLKHFQKKIRSYTYEERKKDFIKEKLKECKRNSLKKRREYIKTAGALLLLPSFFDKIPLKHFLVFDLENKYEAVQNSFVIIGSKSLFAQCLNEDTEFTVFAEKTRLCSTHDLRAAFFSYVAAHYIFNIEYPQECSEMIGILEKLFMKIEPDKDEFTERMQDVQTFLLGSESPS